MAAQIEIELGGMCDTNVNCGAGWYIARFTTLLFLVSAEEPSMMPLLNNNKCDAWLITSLQFDASLTQRSQFMLQHMWELALRHTVAIKNDAVWFVAARGLVEHNQQLTHHAAELLDNFLAMLLNAHGSRVSGWMGVHGSDNGSNRRFFVVTGWWVCDIGTQEYNRLIKYLRSNRWYQNGVNTTQFDVDFQTQIGQCLR